MEKADIFTKMVPHMKGILKTTLFTELESLYLQMVHIILENLKMGKKKGKVYFFTKTEIDTLDNGKTIKNMEREVI